MATAEQPVDQNLVIQRAEKERNFLRKYEQLKAQQRNDEGRLKAAYAAHLAAGGKRIYFRDGKELFSDS